jgi:hypothetical protein
MSDDLDQELRKALRPVDPGEAFARNVWSRIDTTAHRGHAPFRWQWAAALATLAVGSLALYGWQVKRAEGLEARRQLIEALHVTGEKLDLASRAVKDSTGATRDSGA